MQIRCNFPDISYLSETQKNTFQFLKKMSFNKEICPKGAGGMAISVDLGQRSSLAKGKFSCSTFQLKDKDCHFSI